MTDSKDTSKDASKDASKDDSKHPVSLLGENIKNLIEAETSVRLEDLDTLRDINIIIERRYQILSSVTEDISKGVDNIRNKFESLKPYIAEIDSLEEAVSKLEEATHNIDTYLTSLESSLAEN